MKSQFVSVGKRSWRWCRSDLFERVQQVQRTIGEEIVDVLVRQVLKEIFEVARLAPQERVQRRVAEHVVAVPGPLILKDSFERVSLVRQEEISEGICELFVGGPAPQVAEHFVAGFVAVPAPLDLKEIVGVGFVPREQTFLSGFSTYHGSLSSTSGRAVLCGHVGILREGGVALWVCSCLCEFFRRRVLTSRDIHVVTVARVRGTGTGYACFASRATTSPS